MERVNNFIETFDTSRAAYAAIKGKRAAEGRNAVLKAIKNCTIPCVGITDEEGIDVTGMNPSSYRPRRVELVKAGLVVFSGFHEHTKAGKLAKCWRLAK